MFSAHVVYPGPLMIIYVLPIYMYLHTMIVLSRLLRALLPQLTSPTPKSLAQRMRKTVYADILAQLK